jgi:hypothetical protein
MFQPSLCALVERHLSLHLHSNALFLAERVRAYGLLRAWGLRVQRRGVAVERAIRAGAVPHPSAVCRQSQRGSPAPFSVLSHL